MMQGFLLMNNKFLKGRFLGVLCVAMTVSLLFAAGCGDGSKTESISLTKSFNICGVNVPAAKIWTSVEKGESADGSDVIWAYSDPDEYCKEHIFVKTYTNGETESFETLASAIPDFTEYKDLDKKYTFETSRELENGTTVSLYFNDSYDGKKLSNYRALIVGYAPSGEGFTLFFDCDEPDETAVLTDDLIREIYNSLDFNPEEAVDWYEVWKAEKEAKAAESTSSSGSSSSSKDSSSSSKPSGGYSSSSPTYVTDTSLRVKLMSYAEDAVKEKLKSPSSAKFPWSPDDYTFKDYGSSNDHPGYIRYLVNGYVDAQNSFGAETRTKWAVEIDYSKSSDAYYVIRVLFE